MTIGDQQRFAEGDTVVFDDAHTGETKYGLVERGYGGSILLRIISRDKAGPNPKVFIVRQPCSLESQENGNRVCGSHHTELVACAVESDLNPAGLGHVECWACPVSGRQFLVAAGL